MSPMRSCESGESGHGCQELPENSMTGPTTAVGVHAGGRRMPAGDVGSPSSGPPPPEPPQPPSVSAAARMIRASPLVPDGRSLPPMVSPFCSSRLRKTSPRRFLLTCRQRRYVWLKSGGDLWTLSVHVLCPAESPIQSHMGQSRGSFSRQAIPPAIHLILRQRQALSNGTFRPYARLFRYHAERTSR